jgi:GNAT superfamily N-acetyltransferase
MSHIEIRHARADDREAVLAFCARTWDWGDYIQFKWDHWLHDPRGTVLVGTSDGRPTAVGHLLIVNERDALLEGLRVDPQYRRQGQAVALAEAIIAEAVRWGTTHIRAITASENMAAQRVFRCLHMRQVGGFVPFTAPRRSEPYQRNEEGETTQLATLNDLDEIIDHFKASPVGGFYYADFIAYVITAKLLQRQLEAQQVYLLKRRGCLEGLAIAEPLQDAHSSNLKLLSIGYINGMTTEAIRLIVSDLHRRLQQLELEALFVCAPDLALVRNALTGINYTWNGNVFNTYERDLTVREVTPVQLFAER